MTKRRGASYHLSSVRFLLILVFAFLISVSLSGVAAAQDVTPTPTPTEQVLTPTEEPVEPPSPAPTGQLPTPTRAPVSTPEPARTERETPTNQPPEGTTEVLTLTSASVTPANQEADNVSDTNQEIVVSSPNLIGCNLPEEAIASAVEQHRGNSGFSYYYSWNAEAIRQDDWAQASAVRIDKETGESVPSGGILILAHLIDEGVWQARLPEDRELYNEWLDQIPDTFIDDLVKDLSRWNSSQSEIVRAASQISGHYLPWPSPYGARVTTNYNTHGVGQIDFAIDVTSVYATKSGTIVYANDSHPDSLHGNSSSYATYNNVVVIQHSTSEYTIYLHLRNGSIPSWIKSGCPNGHVGQTCAVSVQRGQKIAEMGNTGWSTGTHLHLSTASSYYVDRNNTDWADEDGDGNTSELTYTAFATTSSHVTVDFVEYNYSQLSSWPNSYTNKVYSQNGGTSSACPAPQLTDPSNGATLTSQTITFRWNTLNCGDGYTFRIKDTSNMDSGGTTIVDTGAGETSWTATIGTQWNNRDLYWGVKAANVQDAQWAVRRFRIEPNQSRVAFTLYEGTTFGGASYDGRDTITNLESVDWNDRANSMKIYDGFELIFCEHADFNGACERKRGPEEYANLAAFDLHQKVSSIFVCPVGNCPVPATPSNLRVTNKTANSISLAWNDNSTFEREFRVYRRDGASWLHIQNVGANTTTYTVAGLTCGTTYELGVSASWFGGESNRATVYGTTNACPDTTPPSVPVLVSPGHGSSTTDTTPTFDWQDSSGGPTQYQLQVDNNSNFASPEIGVSPTSSSYTPTSALSYATYYWRVRARDAAGNWSAWSTVRNFTITVQCPAPAAPGLSYPANDVVTSNNLPDFAWQFVSAASVYQIQIDDTASFTSPVASVSTTSNYYALSSNLSDGVYYWRVRGRNTTGSCNVDGAWSSTRALSIDTTAPTASITSPVDGAVLTDSPIVIKVAASDSLSGVSDIQFFAGYSVEAGVTSQSEVAAPRPVSLAEARTDSANTMGLSAQDYWHEIGWDDNGADGWSFAWNPGDVPDQTGVAFFIYAYDHVGNYVGDSVSNIQLDLRANVELRALFTTDGNGLSSAQSGPESILEPNAQATAIKNQFRPGDPIMLWMAITNEFDSEQLAILEWDVKDAQGVRVQALSWREELSLSVGDQYWWLNNTTIPSSSLPGLYTFTGIVEHNGVVQSLSHQFTVAPGGIDLIIPRGATTDTTPRYKWTEVEGATGYQLWVVYFEDGRKVWRKTYAPRICNDNGICAVTPQRAQGHGDYKWMVTAYTPDGEVTSEWGTYSIDVQAPELIGPFGTITDTTPRYRWTVADGATAYELLVTRTATGAVEWQKTYATRICDAGRCAVTPGRTLPRTGYTFKVQAIKPSGGVWSEPGQFTIR